MLWDPEEQYLFERLVEKASIMKYRTVRQNLINNSGNRQAGNPQKFKAQARNS